MPSKQVTDRQKSATAVVAAIETHGSAAAVAIAAALEPHLQSGEKMPDVALLLRLMGRGIHAEMQRLVNADAAHFAELADDDAPRRLRDETVGFMRQECIDLREVVTGVYGSATTARIMSGPIPRDPVVLARFVQTIEANLDNVVFPAPRIAGASIDKTAIRTRLASLRQTLEQCIEKVALEVREAQGTQAAKDKALDAFDHSFGIGASTTSDLLRMASMPEQAARVRPSSRKPGQTATDAGDDAQVADDSAANG